MVRAILALMVPPLTVVVCLLFCASWAMPANELTRWQMARAFAAMEHPPDSELVAPVNLFGILDGAGNHCDFLVGHWRRSEASGQALREAYGPALSVYRPDEPMAEDNYAPNSIQWREMPKVPGVYLVYDYDGMNLPNGDIRCW